jgi:alkylhydroperoxidase family enzyme
MRPDQPRLDPIPPVDWSPELEKLKSSDLSDEPPNIFKTLAHHPALFRRWTVFANHVLFKSTLGFRERETAILRVGWRCQAPYEFGQHTIIGRRAGLSDEEITALTHPVGDHPWSERDRLVIEATDMLFEHQGISDEMWDALTAEFSTTEVMDLIFAVGQYQLVSMALNSLGVEIDEGVPGFPDGAGPEPPSRAPI